MMDTLSNIPRPERKRGPTFKQRLADFFAELYKINLFIVRFFKEAFLPPFEFKEIVRQCFEVGVRLICVNIGNGLYCGFHIHQAIASVRLQALGRTHGYPGWYLLL